jgi:putative protease
VTRPLELLAPAKNLECGKAAIDHGADAVYIGAQRFGARAAAGNSVVDIAELCRYAHQFDAKVYVTVNTIIYDDELEDTRRLLEELQQSGVDAVLVQDMAILQMRNFSFDLHASTQTDNRTAEKVAWLCDLGFSRVVLARELSIGEIRAIHEAVPDVELEVFVHGALCVSYSGQCYASQYCFQRSANRGECAQFCRMQFDLLDADGRVIEHDRHLLSLKDMCQIDNLEALAEAGATSFKIEGRLKDVAYVKNVTAAYSERLNQIIRRHPDLYCRASRGHCRYTFTPNLQKTFNRGYTDYFARGRRPDIASFDTPKAMGEFVGTVKEIRRDSFTVAGTATFANGDGLCFLNRDRLLEGFRVNRVEGNRLFPLKMPANLRPGLRLYRNNDQEMERLLGKKSAERKMTVTMALRATADGFSLQMGDAVASIVAEHQEAQKDPRENIIRQLTKLGGTPFECSEVDIPADFNYFIPSSLLAELRRNTVEAALALSVSPPLELCSLATGGTQEPSHIIHQTSAFTPQPSYHLPYLYNASNALARAFYEQQGIQVADAFEVRQPAERLVMQCRHCLRFALGRCVKHGGRKPEWKEPLSLRLGDGRQFRLEFDCRHCQMNVYADE